MLTKKKQFTFIRV